MRARTIPGEEAWRGWEDHPDARRAHALLFSRSAAEVQRHFGEDRSVDRACELLHVPRGAFRYYAGAFADFVTSEAARGDPLSASAFLRLLVDREKRDPGSVAEAYDDLAPAVDYVAARQEAFQAEPGDYGSFEELARRIRGLCGRGSSGTG